MVAERRVETYRGTRKPLTRGVIVLMISNDEMRATGEAVSSPQPGRGRHHPQLNPDSERCSLDFNGPSRCAPK